MAVYYQHIGQKLAARDFPRSLGTREAGLIRFGLGDVRPYLGHLPPDELADIAAKVRDFAPTGFQVWGIPSGAAAVLAGMVTGDFLLLLESAEFRYVGQVIHRASEMCWDLSDHIWGEQRFPILVLLQGELIDYAWADFVADFGFAANYHMRGNTMRLGDERLLASRFGGEEAFVAALLATKGIHTGDLERDFSEFGNNLVAHLRTVRVRERQRAFREAVLAAQGRRCALCGLDVPVALDAAHVVPKEEDGSDDPRNGLALCAVHHRMYDADLLAIEPDSLRVIARPPHSLEQLRVVVDNLAYLQHRPHANALRWRWDRFAEQAQPTAKGSR
jgi:hypothetical protein